MHTPLALLNLWNDKPRTAVALLGTAFAVVLVLMQLGFFRSVLHTASILYDQLEFDVAVTSANYRQMLKPGTFPRARLIEARSLRDVASAEPVSFSLQLYQNPENGLKRSILVVGVDPRRNVLRMIDDAQLQTILVREQVLLDALSRPEYGPRHVSLRAQIADRAVLVTGLFELGCGFGADGTVVVSDQTFSDLIPFQPVDDVNLGLIRVRPGSDVATVVAELRRSLPPDVAVLSRGDFLQAEEMYWVVKTSVGVIFGLGVAVAVLVGMTIVYQVLSADIAKRMPEYATLKAMGYSRGYLSRVVLTQAAVIGALGFLPGYLIADVLYAITRREANIWMELGTVLPIVTFVLSVLMCCVSGLASLRKVHHADPADLFA
jgi:putative ABC transport system permease protein